jgi:hypothetical protein
LLPKNRVLGRFDCGRPQKSQIKANRLGLKVLKFAEAVSGGVLQPHLECVDPRFCCPSFSRDDSGRLPQRHLGTLTVEIVDICHFIVDSIAPTGQLTLSDIEFIETSCNF